jgi:hypothetical protein
MSGTEGDPKRTPAPSGTTARSAPVDPEARGAGASLPWNVEDLLDTVESQADDPMAALEALRAATAKRIAYRAEWDPKADDATRRAESATQGGAMAAHPETHGNSVRPFLGYDRERAAYERLKPELLARAEGKFVVFVGEECEGPVETFPDALRAGYRRFGLGPLYVKQVLAVEPVDEFSRDVRPCPS